MGVLLVVVVAVVVPAVPDVRWLLFCFFV